MSAVPTSDDNANAVTWTVAAAGTRGGNAQSGVCSVETTPGATFGKVTAGSSAAVGDICTVTLTGSTTTQGYEAWVSEFVLTLRQIRPLKIYGGHVSTYHYCVIFEGGKLKCWGENTSGQLGIGGINNRGDNDNEMGSSLPFVNLGSGRSAVQVALCDSHTCAILDNGDIKCWGAGSNGRLGYGNIQNKKTPPSAAVNLGSSKTAKWVTAGRYHNCAILNDDTLKCWGYGSAGRLGYGDKTNQYAPPSNVVNLGSERTAVRVEAGSSHVCAVLDNGSMKCWGASDDSQLGTGSYLVDSATSPVAVALAVSDRAEEVFSGERHSCAILNGGTLKCWGDNTYGQTGRGGIAYSPIAVNLGTNTVLQLTTGTYHTCAVLDNHKLKCWGHNSHGQLGLGDTTNRSTPPSSFVNLGTESRVRMVAAGENHTCAILYDYTVKCWGEHAYGSLGAGAVTTTPWGDGNNSDGNSEMGDNLAEVELL